MTGMEHAIDRAARAEADRKARDEYWCGDPDVFAAGAEWAVEHLRIQGLLAPAPLREEWRAYSPGRGVGYPDVSFVAALEEVEGQLDLTEMDPGAFGTERDWRVESRHVTPWLPVDRAEGDGRADASEPTVRASQLRAFARLCVDGGDMTPAAARMLDRIIEGDGRAVG